MTEDTRIALEVIRPLAAHLNIEVDADNKLLYCNGQAIGISCNSTYATINEFLGYAFLNMCHREPQFRYELEEAKELVDVVKRYWISDEMLEKMGIKRQEDDT